MKNWIQLEKQVFVCVCVCVCVCVSVCAGLADRQLSLLLHDRHLNTVPSPTSQTLTCLEYELHREQRQKKGEKEEEEEDNV